MIACEVLIAGGGPAGSACAWRLRQAGLDVLVMDKAEFPRDKVCAGWITPDVIRDLEIDPDDYRGGRTFQPIVGFRIGVIGGRDAIDVRYGRPVSFGIRRCEFDHYLLQRANARLLLGTPITKIRRDGAHWVVNDAVRASVLVGAGGHFCSVSRVLNGEAVAAPLVAAQEAEFVAEPDEGWSVAPECPELYFCADFEGYGWCFRKDRYLNVGFGRFAARALPKSTAAFVDYLKSRGRIPPEAAWRWRGHAYLVASRARRRAVDDGVVLVGDAAGIADPRSGEGILPAIESGLMAASTILQAGGRYTRDRLAAYERRIEARFGASAVAALLSRIASAAVPASLGLRLMRNPWFVRRVVLDRWFLHSGDGQATSDRRQATGN
jgi:geranylgeranyl reductase family protein